MEIKERDQERFMELPFMKMRDRRLHGKHELRLPWIGFVPNKLRNHMIAMLGEFTGTFLFLFFAYSGTQVANAAAAGESNGNGGNSDGSLSAIPNAGTLLYISLVFGFSLAVNAWVFFRVSGGLFNPAVTLGMALIGAVTWPRAGLTFIAQILGSMSAAGVVDALFPGPLNVSTTLGGGTSVAQGLFIEMFLTTMLMLTIFMLAAEKHKGTFLAPVGIGLALFIAELSGVYFTGGSLNPARSFGPCVALHVFPEYHWIYWLGPLLGSFIAVVFYRLLSIMEYETANPGQDFNEHEASMMDVDEDKAATGDDVERPDPEDRRQKSRGDGEKQHEYVPEHGGRGDEDLDSSPDTRDAQGGRSRGQSSASIQRQTRSSGGRRDVSGSQRSYQAGPDAERGELGGHYVVSGLRS